MKSKFTEHLETDHNSVDSLLVAGGLMVEPTPVDLPCGGVGVLVPDGVRLEQLPAVNPKLGSPSANVRLDDRDSFVQYVNRFKTGNTMIAADIEGRKVRATIDYHGAVGTADYLRHLATYPCPFSLEWDRWREIDGRPVDPVDLAYFVEEMMHTIAKPDASDLMEVVTDLNIQREVNFKKGVRLKDGRNEIRFEEVDSTHGANGEIVVPDEISIVAPIFMGGEIREATAKLRYRLTGGKLAFVLDILNRRTAEQLAFAEVVEHIRSETEAETVYGSLG